VTGGAASGLLAVALTAWLLARGPRPERRRSGGSRPVPGARWARPADLRPLTGGGPGRIALGETTSAGRRRHLGAERLQSVAVVGPTQSGKTSALAVPAILGWDGPVLAASVKADLLAASERWRRGLGTVWCLDPAGASGRSTNAWNPLRAARTWPGARRVAADLTEVARSGATTADGEFWYATAAKLLAPLLFAAAFGGASLGDVVRWVDTQEVGEVLDLLEAAAVEEAIWSARASWQREERQRSSVYTTAETVLEPLASAGAADGPDIDPESLLDGTNTVYLCATAHDQRRMRGLFVAVVKEVLEEAFTRASRNGPLDPPLLVVLDEAANIAPVAELDVLAATCAGHGVALVTVWQDLAQLTARYGPRAPTVLNNHRARLFLSGIAEPSTLEHASLLVGETDVPLSSSTTAPGGGRSVTSAPQRRRLLPPEAVRQLPPGTAVLLYGDRPPARIRLVPWWEDRELVDRGSEAPVRRS
jgi:type IV secretion system protein VirD4